MSVQAVADEGSRCCWLRVLDRFSMRLSLVALGLKPAHTRLLTESGAPSDAGRLVG